MPGVVRAVPDVILPQQGALAAHTQGSLFFSAQPVLASRSRGWTLSLCVLTPTYSSPLGTPQANSVLLGPVLCCLMRPPRTHTKLPL